MKRAKEIDLTGKHVVSMDIGQHTTKVVAGRRTNGALELTHAVSFPTPADSCEKGRILNPSALEKAVGRALKERKIRSRLALCSVESNEMVTREVMVPASSDDEVEKMLDYEIQQHMPVSLGDFMVLSKKLDVFSDYSVQKIRALVTAVPKDMVYSYYDLFKSMNLKPVVFDTQSNALDKLVESDFLINDDDSVKRTSFAVLEIGYGHINVSVFKNGRYMFSRLLGQGAHTLDKNLVRSLDISSEEAQRYKLSIEDLNRQADDVEEVLSLESEKAMEMRVLNITRNTINAWLESIEKVMQYYITQSIANRIDRIYLYGGTTRMKGFDRYVQNAYNIPVAHINSLSNVTCTHYEGDHELAAYMNALGTMIRR